MEVKGAGKRSDKEMGISCLPLEAVLLWSKFLLLRIQRDKKGDYYFLYF